MRKLLLMMGVVLLALQTLAQKSINDANAEVRKVSGFHGIRSSTGIKVILTQGNEETVAVSANRLEDRDRIKTEVVDGILKIYYDFGNNINWNGRNDRQLRAYVSAKTINRLQVSSGSSINVEGQLTTSDIEILSSSGGIIHGSLGVSNAKIQQSSGSILELSGTVANKLTVKGNSGSIFRGYDLRTENCEAGVSSGAVVQISVNKDLAASANSGGAVRYRGEALISSVHTSSGGSVNKKSSGK